MFSGSVLHVFLSEVHFFCLTEVYFLCSPEVYFIVFNGSVHLCIKFSEEHCRQNATPLTELTAEEEVVRQGHELKNERRRRIKSIIG